MKIPHVHLKKYQQKISNRKRAARSELGLQEWSAQELHKQDFIDILIDNCPRIDYEKVSKEEFVTKYEIPNIPCVIQNGMKEWPAMTEWTVTKLAYRYRHEKFKVGEDDDEKVVYLGLKYYFHYALKDPHGAAIDDSPLYIFDATFGKRSIHHSARRSEVDSDSRHRYDPNSSQAPCHLVEDYQVPKYFTDDLFSLAEGRRPPFRWLVIGPARSGTGIHVDPLGTSAWNALISGHKRWVLFPPDAPKSIIHPKLKDHEASTWFSQVYPKLRQPSQQNPHRCVGEDLGMVEIIQKPGEIVFVPGGWHHIVINTDFAIAVTQNFASFANIEYVWLKTRFSRPKLASKIRFMMLDKAIRPEKAMKESKPTELNPKVYRDGVSRIDSLQTLPPLETSSSNSSSSSSSSSSDSDAQVVCTCHNRKRRKL